MVTTQKYKYILNINSLYWNHVHQPLRVVLKKTTDATKWLWGFLKLFKYPSDNYYHVYASVVGIWQL